MKTTRTLILIVTALTATALATTTASAQETPVEAVEEITGDHCDFDLANCVGHVEGSSNLLHPNMVNVVSACHDEFDGVAGENGSGHVINQVLSGPAGVCNSVPCPPSTGESEWPINEPYELGPNETGSELRYCLLGGDGLPRHCDLPVHVEEDPTEQHHYVITVANTMHGSGSSEFQCPSGLWVRGTWETEDDGGDGSGEINHL